MEINALEVSLVCLVLEHRLVEALGHIPLQELVELVLI